MSAVDVVETMWAAMYAGDWSTFRGCFTDDAVYYDVPVGPAAAARGPEHIEARVRLGFDPLERVRDESVTRIADGDVVMTEHVEVWDWPTGEHVELPFVSVQRLRDGKIALWKDYWNQPTLMDAAPEWWHERLATADLSWIFDATGSA